MTENADDIYEEPEDFKERSIEGISSHRTDKASFCDYCKKMKKSFVKRT